MIYPIVAAQVVTGCCRRVKKKLHAEKFSDEIILVLPYDANYGEHEGFFPALVDKINARFKIKISKILSYSTNHNPAEKFETEINLVAELVRRGKLDKKNYLVKDGSLEYKIFGDRKFNAKNYSFVAGVSKKFNPTHVKDSSGKINPGLIAELPALCRTPVTICERGGFHGGNKFAVWYVRLRDKKFSVSLFDGVVKVEKILLRNRRPPGESHLPDFFDGKFYQVAQHFDRNFFKFILR